MIASPISCFSNNSFITRNGFVAQSFVSGGIENNC